MADRPGLPGSMDPVEGVAIALKEIESTGAKRVNGPTRHAIGIDSGQGIALDHCGGSMPRGPYMPMACRVDPITRLAPVLSISLRAIATPSTGSMEPGSPGR